MTASRAELLALNPDCERILGGMSDEAKAAMFRDWQFRGRPEQLAPVWDWRWWAVVTGRGWGKTRVGAEWSLDRCEQFAAHRHEHLLGLMNATYGEVRALQIGGVSGIERCAGRRGHVVDIPVSKLEGRIRVWDEGWQDTDVEIHTADKPDRSRGRNFASLWNDEAAKHKHAVDRDGGTAFTNADLGLRARVPKGLMPQGVVTTTPKPIKLIKDLLAGEYGETAISRGSMFENKAHLDPTFMDAIRRRYDGSRLGGQEIHGLLLDDVEGALWTIARLEATRHRTLAGATPEQILAGLPSMVRIVVGVDPSGGESGTCGIVVAGMAWVDGAPHMFVLEDCSMSVAADKWAAEAVKAYWRWGCDALIFERNYGGDMGPTLISMIDARVNTEVKTASRGKEVRAEPVATLWSEPQRRGHIVGWWPELEEQLTTWVPGDDSPDRLDAAVWCGYGLISDLVAIDETRAYGQQVADLRL